MKSIKARWRFFAVNVTLAILLTLTFTTVNAQTHIVHASSPSFTREISSSGSTSFAASSYGTDELAWPEFAGTDDDAGAAPYNGPIVDRSHSGGAGHGWPGKGGNRAKSNPEVQFSFDGLNHR